MNLTSTVEIDDKNSQRNHYTRLKAPTDSHNADYLINKANQPPPPDFVNQYISQHSSYRRKEREEGPLPPWGKVFSYSGQKLNYNTWLLGEMQKDRINDNNNAYVYSKEFSSLSFPLVEPSKPVDKNFQPFYSANYINPEDKYRHPLKPSLARSEELNSPWTPPNLANIFAKEELTSNTNNRPQFDNRPRHTLNDFGYPGNENWNRSVHLVGEGIEQAKLDADKKAKEEWKSKLVVDDPSFRVLWSTTRTKPIVVEKNQSILKDAPKKEILKKVYVPPPPVTIFNSPYEFGNSNPQFLSRQFDKTKFIAADDFNSTGGRAHLLYEKKGVGKKIAPLRADEKKSFTWRE